ncbi:MAG: histidine kinase dimerization/phospho-acceptor domain-containing protein [Candidatus Sumerlaeia bacterium]|nr:histidine kinase dimerization/phospho-acceptor domain-containing protein [Candidatus Sumerlaeia bacterium]
MSSSESDTTTTSSNSIPQQQKTDSLKDVRNIGRVKQAQTRLVISIPSLLFSFTLLVCLLLRFNINELGENTREKVVADELFALGDMTLWIGIAASLAAGGVGVLIAWSIVRPLGELLESMRKVAEGNLNERAEVERFVELGNLGSAFNNMVENLHTLFEQRNRQMRDAAAGTVITVDGYGKILGADNGLKKVTGANPDQFIGTHIVEFFEQRFRRKNEENISKVINESLLNAQKGLTTTQSISVQQRDSNQPLNLSIRVTALESSDMNAPNAVFDIRDLSTLKGFLDQIQQADRLAALGTLAAGIAHEIRNPLGSIKGMTQLVLEDLQNSPQSPENHAQYLERIRKECDRLDKLVGGIMDFARSEPGPMVECDINRLLQYAYEIARHKVHFAEPASAPEVIWQLDTSLSPILLEENRIHQALLNLIINALEELQNHPKGELRFSTYLDRRHRRRQITIDIQNTSKPLNKEQINRIFEPFVTNKESGTGLGLPIAYQAIITNNGVLDFSYKQGFVHCKIRFPLQGLSGGDLDGSSTLVPKLTTHPPDTQSDARTPQ